MKILGSMGVGGVAIGLAIRFFGHIGKKYENAAANMRGDVRAIETQETLNQNLVETITRMQGQINLLNDKLDAARRENDEWREKYFNLRDTQTSPRGQN